MRVLVPILLVLIALYGVTVAAKPHLAVRRGQTMSAMALNIARIKGIVAFALAAFLLWRTLR